MGQTKEFLKVAGFFGDLPASGLAVGQHKNNH